MYPRSLAFRIFISPSRLFHHFYLPYPVEMPEPHHLVLPVLKGNQHLAFLVVPRMATASHALHLLFPKLKPVLPAQLGGSL